MNQFLGILMTALSVLIAAIVSGLRLKPYMDAGETYTPPTFALYPALIAAALAIPTVLVLRKVQGKNEIDIGPVTLADRQPFMVLWCVLYVTVAVTFFPYQERPKPVAPQQSPRLEKPDTPRQPVHLSLPLFAQNLPVYAEQQCQSEVVPL
jgi:hypothetical protein